MRKAIRLSDRVAFWFLETVEAALALLWQSTKVDHGTGNSSEIA